ncbi:MAG: capsular polysaccharide biosynthesis protein [Paracoccaceae bacterium]
MIADIETKAVAGASPRRLLVYNGGFLLQRRLRRILHLAGYDLRIGVPRPDDLVGIWGHSPTSHRGKAVSEKYGVDLLRVEDAFLRSLHPGRSGEPPLGLLLDKSGVHFDPATPSDLEQILATHPLDDTALMDRARGAIERIREAHLSKYSGFDPQTPLPDPGYVLVIDQTKGDASVTASGAGRSQFLEMLVFAQEEHPGARVIIKSHPETGAGYRKGHFDPEDENDRITILTESVSPWHLFEGAVGVYTISSQMGFEAIYAGHKPRVFGQPFYAGWGLTIDENPVPRRERALTRAQLFAAAMILYPVWYDPHRDTLCPLEDALVALEAQVNAWRADQHGWVASEIRLWKRNHFQKMFGRSKKVVFQNDTQKAEALVTSSKRQWMVWAGKARPEHDGAMRIEDGFLRSRGLGAELVPPLSLVTDDLGIYYDPAKPSRLEHLIATRAEMRPDQMARAQRLIRTLREGRISKYNLGGALPDLPGGPRILVPGQVEDDASITTGAGNVRTNLDLLRAVRTARPDAVIIYKPHPDVEAGLRNGAIDPCTFANVVAHQADPITLLEQVSEVWTMTSLLGFEALLRGVPVVTLGAPFYAGWGLAEDRGTVPPRRNIAVTLEGLAHAALIDYPRYFDPVTKSICPPEVILERLSSGQVFHPGPANRLLSKIQGLFASQSHLWR